MHEVVRKTRDFIEREGLLPRRCAVVVGLSGGPDSVALLRILLELREAAGKRWSVYAAHLNHRLRGAEARRDARFCADLCAGLGVPFITSSRDVRALASRLGISTEEAARRARFEFLEAAAGRVHRKEPRLPVAVALGHHLDDQAETILFRVLRGTGVLGLGGIPPLRELRIAGMRKPVRLVRPLLNVSRREILEYLSDIGQTYRLDRSNVSRKFARNRIRLDLMPLLERRFNPGVTGALANLAAVARQWREALESFGRWDILCGAGEKALDDWAVKGNARLNAAALADLSPAVAQHALRSILHSLKIPLKRITAGHFRLILDEVVRGGRRKIQLPGGIEARREGEFLVLERRPRIGKAETTAGKKYLLKLDRINRIPGLGLRLEVSSRPFSAARFKKFIKTKSAYEEIVDRDRVKLPLCARTLRKGDVFKPLGHSREMPLARFLSKQGLKGWERDRAPVVADRKRIIWVVGVRISDDVKVAGETRRTLRLRANREDARNKLMKRG
jgi:tRNA(Ile)-lysidine synthase